jgi:SAM-dependent methyltransferase
MPLPEAVSTALRDGACVSLVLTRRRRDAADGPDRVTVRPVALRGGAAFQIAQRVGRRELHENVDAETLVRRIEGWFGPLFLDGTLRTATADIAFRHDREGNVRVETRPADRPPPDTAHDRSKCHVIPEGTPCPFLVEIGVMTPDGRVRAPLRRKFRQINRFLELVQDVVPHLPAGPLRIVDFGCGKSYLTFALHHLLAAVHGREVRITGLDRDVGVVQTCRGVCDRLGCAGLEFREGDIASHRPDGPVDMAVSLHACDTATDDALAQAVAWQARVILAVPCCQHELAPQVAADVLSPVLRHGILRDRFAAEVTDALRGAALEACGYAVQIVEFVDLEHTPKNLLIRAVRRTGPSDAELRAARRREYRTLKAFLGIGPTRLDAGLGPPGLDDAAEGSVTTSIEVS